MALSPTDQFFADNGGAAILAAYGISGSPTLETFFSSNLPAKPKEGKSGDRFTRAPATGVAAVAVWQGGMVVCSFAADPQVKLPGVEFRSAFGKQGIGRIAGLAADMMEKPRPVLVHACSTSYVQDLKSPRFTLDPSSIEINGAVGLVLERSRLKAIRSVLTESGLEPAELRKALRLYEAGVLADAPTTEHGTWPLMGEKVNRTLAGILGIKSRIFDAGERRRILETWQLLDALPPSQDPAWSALDIVGVEGQEE